MHLALFAHDKLLQAKAYKTLAAQQPPFAKNTEIQ